MKTVNAQFKVIREWLKANWFLTAIVASVITTTGYLIGPRVSINTRAFIKSALHEDFEQVNTRLDSLSGSVDNKLKQLITITNNKTADTLLILKSVNETYALVKREIPRTVHDIIGVEKVEMAKDTVWRFDPFTGETLGYFLFSLDINGNPIIYEKTSIK